MATARTSKKLENVAASIESNLMDILMPVLHRLRPSAAA
jgi:type VI protein secretion system component VasA